MKLSEAKTSHDVHALFGHFLRDRGIKDTTARRKVLTAVLDLRGHFEAEQVLYALNDRDERVGKATIYRTLPLLVECGILRKVRFDVKQAHYEHAFGEEHHDHMVCRRCGRIVKFSSREMEELRERLGRRHKFHVTGHRLQLSGLCWECSISCPIASSAVPRRKQS